MNSKSKIFLTLACALSVMSTSTLSYAVTSGKGGVEIKKEVGIEKPTGSDRPTSENVAQSLKDKRKAILNTSLEDLKGRIMRVTGNNPTDQLLAVIAKTESGTLIELNRKNLKETTGINLKEMKNFLIELRKSLDEVERDSKIALNHDQQVQLCNSVLDKTVSNETKNRIDKSTDKNAERETIKEEIKKCLGL